MLSQKTVERGGGEPTQRGLAQAGANDSRGLLGYEKQKPGTALCLSTYSHACFDSTFSYAARNMRVQGTRLPPPNRRAEIRRKPQLHQNTVERNALFAPSGAGGLIVTCLFAFFLKHDINVLLWRIRFGVCDGAT